MVDDADERDVGDPLNPPAFEPDKSAGQLRLLEKTRFRDGISKSMGGSVSGAGIRRASDRPGKSRTEGGACAGSSEMQGTATTHKSVRIRHRPIVAAVPARALVVRPARRLAAPGRGLF